ncbi:MAG TPA: RnfABCDGE type electron transport complex subunit A [Candidatus Nanoarchaeia archaeon]|nr:RnfABCDGE type electron transport complex subunit A [Candidatus Nanoarchaeia archaeon]
MSDSLIAILIGAIFVNNFILTRFLGLCPFFGVSKKTKAAVSMGIALTFVTAGAAAVTWVINALVLIPLGLQYLQIIVFILIIATLVQFVEFFIRKSNPILYRALGIYLPLITTNCIVLGVSLINVQRNYNFLQSLTLGVAGGLGFMLAILLMSGIRERLELSKVPKAFSGLPIAFIIAALMSMAFLAFSGMIR